MLDAAAAAASVGTERNSRAGGRVEALEFQILFRLLKTGRLCDGRTGGEQSTCIWLHWAAGMKMKERESRRRRRSRGFCLWRVPDVNNFRSCFSSPCIFLVLYLSICIHQLLLFSSTFSSPVFAAVTSITLRQKQPNTTKQKNSWYGAKKPTYSSRSSVGKTKRKLVAETLNCYLNQKKKADVLTSTTSR